MGIRGVSIDSAVDIAVAKDLVGDKLSIMGNVSPIEILRGTPESIEQAVIDCFPQMLGQSMRIYDCFLDVIFRFGHHWKH